MDKSQVSGRPRSRWIAMLVVTSFMMSSLNASEEVKDGKVTDNNTVPVALEHSELPADTPEPLPVPDTEAIAEVSTPTPASEDTVAQNTTDTVSDEVPVEGDQPAREEEEDVSFFDTIRNVLIASKDYISEKASNIAFKMDFKNKYGEHAWTNEANREALMEAIEARKQADVVREQRELARRIAEEERQRLYDESVKCLALNGFHESRSETADQEVAANAVVLNRLSVGFRGATTVCEVIYTPKQFSWVEQHGTHVPDTTNKIEREAWERSLLIAKRLLDPDATYIDPSNGALYYYNPHIVDWKYKESYVQTAVLGNHRFMTEPDKDHPHYIDNKGVRINPALFNGLSHKEREQLKAEFQNKTK